MIKRYGITSKSKKIVLAIFVSFCWVTSASAALISYDLTGLIRFSVDPDINGGVEESYYTGSLVLDTDTQITNECEVSCTTHRYSISYDFAAIDGEYSYQGGGELYLATLEDAFLTLDGFIWQLADGSQYYSEEHFNYVFDPEPDGWVWHDPDFDITSLISLDLRSGFNHPDVNGREVINSYVFVEQVVPVPAAVWLFGSGLIGLVGLARRKTA